MLVKVPTKVGIERVAVVLHVCTEPIYNKQLEERKLAFIFVPGLLSTAMLKAEKIINDHEIFHQANSTTKCNPTVQLVPYLPLDRSLRSLEAMALTHVCMNINDHLDPSERQLSHIFVGATSLSKIINWTTALREKHSQQHHVLKTPDCMPTTIYLRKAPTLNTKILKR